MYEKLDALILAAVSDGRSPLHDRAVNEEAERIVQATDRDGSQIIDESLRHLRANGLLPLARRLQAKANTEAEGENEMRKLIGVIARELDDMLHSLFPESDHMSILRAPDGWTLVSYDEGSSDPKSVYFFSDEEMRRLQAKANTETTSGEAE